MRWAVTTSSARPKTYVTNVAGIRKLPSRMTAGIRLALPVRKVMRSVGSCRPPWRRLRVMIGGLDEMARTRRSRADPP